MSCVHYKFSSKLDYNTVTFDGLHITLSELKRQIMARERLKATDCDLQITNAQTREGTCNMSYVCIYVYIYVSLYRICAPMNTSTCARSCNRCLTRFARSVSPHMPPPRLTSCNMALVLLVFFIRVHG